MRAIPASPFRRTQRHPFLTARAQQACAGKFCSSEQGIFTQGVGDDNPEDPLNLDASQKRKTVSFFYEGQSEFTVRVAPHAPSQPAPPQPGTHPLAAT